MVDKFKSDEHTRTYQGFRITEWIKGTVGISIGSTLTEADSTKGKNAGKNLKSAQIFVESAIILNIDSQSERR